MKLWQPYIANIKYRLIIVKTYQRGIFSLK